MTISTRTSFSSTQTIIEPDQQQFPLELSLNNNQINLNNNIQPAHNQDQHQLIERSEEQVENENEELEHQRRLRLIDVNRTRTRLIEEEQELALSQTSSSPPTAPISNEYQQPSKEPLETIIPLEILLSPINQKKAFNFHHLLTISQLIDHLLNNWPSEWSQPGSTIPHHTNQFRMVYMGRFLDDQETLNSLGNIRPIIIHLVIKPDEGTVEEQEVDENNTRLCGCFGTLRGRSPGACLIV